MAAVSVAPALPTRAMFRRTLAGAAALPFALLVLFGAVLLWQISQLLDARRWVQHTHDVIVAVREVRGLAFDAEARTRGFLLSGDPAVLDGAEEQAALALASADHLLTRVADNPAQVERSHALREALGRWQSYRQRALARPDEARALVAAAGQPSLGAVRAVSSAMLQEEEALRAARLAHAEATARGTFGLGAGLSLAVGTLLAVASARRLGDTVETYATALRELGARATSLAESEERFRLLVDAVRDHAIYTLDPQGRVASWNAGAERLTGWRSDEVVGRPLTALLPPGSPPDAVERELAAAREQGRFEADALRARKDASTFWAHVSLWPLRDARGVLLGYVKVTRDVTERVEAEQALRRAAEELERRVDERTRALREANAELEAFGYRVSHDLRAPLRAIHGFAEALGEDAADRLTADERDYLRRITGAADRMETLIGDLLEYSRLGRASLRPQRVELGSVVQQALDALRAQAERARAEVSVEPGLPAVSAPRPVVLQVVTNLLGNALKFVAPGEAPRVRVRAERRGGEGEGGGPRVRLWVEDRGIGIAPEHHERIFRVFERLHGQEAYEGTGIGLAIVRRGVERAGGSVGVESTPGAGSRFWVELPAGGAA